jgi:glycosyltransferase involved in cell wall biosynthesis
MACGSALVTTDNGGSRDYALAGDTALVVPPGDIDGLVGSVERLFSDDELRTRLAHAGEQHVKRFDWDLSGEILEGKLTEYLANPSFFQQPPLADGSEREEVR